MVWGIIAVGVMSSSAYAAEPTQATNLVAQVRTAAVAVAAGTVAMQAPPAASASPEVKVTGGLDFPSLYMFRGYRQEGEPKLTLQPYLDVAIAGEKATFNIGVWNSAHTGSLKDAGYGWYETDVYAAVTMGMFKALYTAYTYPKIDSATVHELMLSAAFDHTLAPSVGVAFEFSKASGADKGVYFEAGIAPTLSKEDAKATVTLPVKVGLSLKDYYQDTFGYLSIAPTVLIPVNDHFDIHGNLTVYALGNGPKATNNDKRGQVTGTVGLGFAF